MEQQAERTSYLSEKEVQQGALTRLEASLAEAQDKCRSFLAFSLLCLAIAILYMLNYGYMF